MFNNMYDDEEFFINDDELAADHQLTLLDEAKVNVLNYVTKLSEELKSNLEYSEIGNYQANLEILSAQIGILIELESVDDTNMSDEEMQDIIERAMNKSTEITYANMSDILPEEKTMSVDDSSDGNEDSYDNGTDF